MSQQRAYSFVFFFVLLLAPPVRAGLTSESAPGIEEEIFEPPTREIAYSLVKDLANARAIRRQGQKKSQAQWNGSRFQFQEAPGVSDIFTTENYVVGGSTHEAVALQIQLGYDVTLIFPRVPPGQKLKIFFAMPDIAFRGEKFSPVTMEAWIGQKKILETPISKKGWLQEQVDLDLAFLLQRNYALTFKFTSADTQTATVLIYGSIDLPNK